MKRNRLIISEKGKPYIQNGQSWMYINNLEENQGCKSGEIVDIYDLDNNYLATGFYSAKNHIVCRIFSYENLEEYNDEYFKNALLTSINKRLELMSDNFDNCRLVYGEADNIPGLIVDRYSEIIVTQISCCGIEQRKDMIYKAILEILAEKGEIISGIYERNDIKARDNEGLPQYKGFYKGLKLRPLTSICENGLWINVDIENGQKTGYFLDQKDNRLALRNISKDKTVLDCFCHTGGFGLNAAYGGAKKVSCVDVSATALKQAKQNADNNNLTDNMEFIQDDVFAFLDKVKKGQYDIIVLDPPAFTKSRRTVDHAYNGYLQINSHAMTLLNNDGFLVTCSCSRFMEKENFEKMLKEAAEKANVNYQIQYYAAAAKDHPINTSNQETDYLKFYILKINSRN